jgi:hypothetical protein
MQQGIFCLFQLTQGVGVNNIRQLKFGRETQNWGPLELLSSYEICLTAANNTVNAVNNIFHHT